MSLCLKFTYSFGLNLDLMSLKLVNPEQELGHTEYFRVIKTYYRMKPILVYFPKCHLAMKYIKLLCPAIIFCSLPKLHNRNQLPGGPCKLIIRKRATRKSENVRNLSLYSGLFKQCTLNI